MNTNKLLSFVLLLLLLVPMAAYAGGGERYCFQEPNGSIYDLRGGKLGKKAFAVKVTHSICVLAPMPGIATIAQLSNGYALTMLIGRDAPTGCQSYVVSAVFDANLQVAQGTVDILPRNSPPDGSFIMTQITCPALITIPKLSFDGE